MRILVIGDFHGDLSKSLENKIKKINPDLILSPGDFCGDKTLSKFFFKKIYGKKDESISLKDLLILKGLEEISFRRGVLLIKNLKKLKIPMFSIRGNWDPTPFGRDILGDLDEENIDRVSVFEKLENSKFSFIDLSLKEFDTFILVGGVSSTSPQRIKKNMVEKLVKQENITLKEAKKSIALLTRNWNIRQKLYDLNFKRALDIRQKTGKKIIFLTHNCPYNTKLDKVRKGPARGNHYGSYQERLIIKRYKPDLVFCGHMHENFGKVKLGKSAVYNVGSALDGKFIAMEI